MGRSPNAGVVQPGIRLGKRRQISVVNCQSRGAHVVELKESRPTARKQTQSVEVIEHRVEPRAALLREMPDIPRGERFLDLSHDVHPVAEERGPLVEVDLIAKLSVFIAGEAPIEAALLPPTHDLSGAIRTVERQKLNAKAAAVVRTIVLGCVRVLGNEHLLPRLVQLAEQDSRVSQKKHVGIDVSRAEGRWVAIEDGLGGEG